MLYKKSSQICKCKQTFTTLSESKEYGVAGLPGFLRGWRQVVEKVVITWVMGGGPTSDLVLMALGWLSFFTWAYTCPKYSTNTLKIRFHTLWHYDSRLPLERQLRKWPDGTKMCLSDRTLAWHGWGSVALVNNTEEMQSSGSCSLLMTERRKWNLRPLLLYSIRVNHCPVYNPRKGQLKGTDTSVIRLPVMVSEPNWNHLCQTLTKNIKRKSIQEVMKELRSRAPTHVNWGRQFVRKESLMVRGFWGFSPWSLGPAVSGPMTGRMSQGVGACLAWLRPLWKTNIRSLFWLKKKIPCLNLWVTHILLCTHVILQWSASLKQI